MALSFKDSMKKAQEASVVTTYESDIPVNVGTSYMKVRDNLPYSSKYPHDEYAQYEDPNFSIIDKNKNITLDPSQINLTQEINSQYVPFKMFRYYDGVDMLDMSIVMYSVTPLGKAIRVTPVNFQYDEDYIYFGIVIPGTLCSTAGKVKFEMRAEGINQASQQYRLVTRSAEFNVLESLEGSADVIDPEPDTGWITAFLTQVTNEVAKAQNAANEAKASAATANESAQEAMMTVATAKTELENTVDAKITEELKNYYTKTEVDKMLENVDLSDVYEKIDNIDGLAAFNVECQGAKLTFYNGETVIKEVTIDTSPSAEWVASYGKTVDNKISEATTPITQDLESYRTTTDADLKAIHESIDDLPETLKTDYYTKTDIDGKLKDKASATEMTTLKNSVAAIEQQSNTNKTNISTLGTKVGALESALENIDQAPQKTYDATYTEDNVYTLWEIEHEGESNESRTAKSQFKIVGGGGGSATATVLKIEYVTRSPLTVTVNDKAIIKYKFSGQDSSGDEVSEGTYTWKIGNKIIATGTAVNGENTFDATEFISVGSQKLSLTIVDDSGSLVTKTWTVQKIDIRLESSFNDKLAYPIGEVMLDYTPYGAISKEVHFKLDDVEIGKVTTNSSGIPMSYTLPSQTHGAHFVEAYITAEINNSTVESNHIFKDVIWYDSTLNVPVISCISRNLTIKQYDTANIVYTVFDPSTETPVVKLAVDGKEVSTLTLDSNTQTWQYKSSDVGSHVLTITCGETVKTINVEVEKLDINVSPVTAGLAFDFNPVGRSNNDENKLWSDKEVTMTVSENFDWVNGGYQMDSNGDQYFCVKSGTTATINYNLFADDPKRNGKEFKVIFKTTNVRKRSASFLSCINNDIGLDMKIESANIYSSNDSLYSPYCEDDIIEFEFNINKSTDIPMVLTYEDGVGNRPMLYTADASFIQSEPQPIVIGSEDCDVHIYRMKAYSSSLSDRDILSNFIADSRNAEEMIERYNRNQIYDENGALTPEVFAEKCPDLRVIMVDAPWFTNDKSNKVENTTIRMIYKDGDAVLDNWSCTGAKHSGRTQTLPLEYGNIFIRSAKENWNPEMGIRMEGYV